MTEAEEQQTIKNIAEISKDIKELVTMLKKLTTQQADADEKAYGQLVNIAHKR